MKSHSLLLLGALSIGALSLTACNSDKKSESDKKAETKTGEPAEETKSSKSKPPVDEGIDVPTEEDFEEAVASQIKEDSDLQKELDVLEKEIGN